MKTYLVAISFFILPSLGYSKQSETVDHKDCVLAYDALSKTIDLYKKNQGPSNSELLKLLGSINTISDKHPECEEKIIKLQEEMSSVTKQKAEELKKLGAKDTKNKSSSNCQNLKYTEIPIMETLAERRKGEEGNFQSKANAMELYNQACNETKCIMDRDKISFDEAKTRMIKTGVTPMMKKMIKDAIDELDIKTCSL